MSIFVIVIHLLYQISYVLYHQHENMTSQKNFCLRQDILASCPLFPLPLMQAVILPGKRHPPSAAAHFTQRRFLIKRWVSAAIGTVQAPAAGD